MLLTICSFTVSAEPFRFVVLPDTQIYSWNLYREDAPNPDDAYTITNPQGSYPYFVDQTRWIVENADDLNIKHVIHLGDVVQNAEQIQEWERAKAALSILDEGNISYGIAVGGHDVDNGDFSNYLHYFGPQHYEHHSWYGRSPSGLSNYQIIPHEQYAFIFINVAIHTPEAEVQWAMDLLAKHHDKFAIISTHSYLWDYRFGFARNGEKVGQGLLFGQTLNAAEFSSQTFYETMIAKHPNILMVMAGHVHGSLTRQDGRNGANLPVFEVLADFQDGRNGGDGYLRIYELDIENNQLTGHTYSPSTDRYRTIFEEFVDSIKVVAHHALDDGRFPTLLAEWVLSRLKADVVPDINVVTNHPEYLADPDYYEQQLKDLYGGEVPPHIGSLGDWEALWMLTYAHNRKAPLDYRANFRAPQFTHQINYQEYLKGELVAPSPFRQAFKKLIDAINGLQTFLEEAALLLGTLYE
ncbi:MAG: hypothetical protein MI976_29895 [Pseudomonadales bacterium]|nr:hypothetical protein [Pseudomonadales bacterium]